MLYTNLHHTVDRFREQNHLLYRYDSVPLTELLSDFINRVQTDMIASPPGFRFQNPDTLFTVQHEGQALQFLELVNRGIPRRKDGTLRLRRPTRHFTPSSAIGGLFLGDLKQYYANPVCNVEDERFVIYLRRCLVICALQYNDFFFE